MGLERRTDDRSETVVGLFISSGIMLSCGNISSEEPEPEPEPVVICIVDLELEARISDTLWAREH